MQRFFKLPSAPGRTGRLTPPSRLHLPRRRLREGGGLFLDEGRPGGLFPPGLSCAIRRAFEMVASDGWTGRLAGVGCGDVTAKAVGRRRPRAGPGPPVSERLMILTTRRRRGHARPDRGPERESGANPSSRTSWNTSSTSGQHHGGGSWLPGLRFSPLYFQSHSADTIEKCERGPRPIFRWATWTSRVLTSGGTCAPFLHRRPKGSG